MAWTPETPTTQGAKSPFAWWRVDYGVYRDIGPPLVPAGHGETVRQWNDIVSDRTLSQATSEARPTLNTSYINGRPALTFDGGDSLVVAAANDWKFLHDGTGATTFIVWKVSADNADQACVLLDNANTSTSANGYTLLYDNRASSNAKQRINNSVYKSSSGNPAWSSVQDHSGLGGVLHLTTTGGTSALYAIHRDGHLARRDAGTMSSPSSSNPTYPLHVGKPAVSTSYHLQGAILEILFYAADLAIQDLREVWTYLRNRYPSVMFADFDVDNTLTLVDDSLNNSFGSGAISRDKKLIAMYCAGSTHGGYDHSSKYRLSTDMGVSWGAAQTLHANDANYSYMSYVSNDDDGNLHVAVRRDKDDLTEVEALYQFSADNADTWSSLVDTNASGNFHTSKSYVGGTVFKTATGRLLIPVYGYKDPGDTNYTIGLMYSDDSGATWTYALVADGHDPSPQSWGEAGFYQSNNTIVCIIRTPANGIYASWSTDDGVTWSTPVLRHALFSAMPMVTYLRACDTALAVLRYDAQNDGQAWNLSFTGPTARIQIGRNMGVAAPGEELMTYGRPIVDTNGRVAIVWSHQKTDADADTFFAPFGAPTAPEGQPTSKRLAGVPHVAINCGVW